MLEPSQDRRLPAGWRPSTPGLNVVVRYRDRRRGPDRLWTSPLFVDEQDTVLLYLAVGPAGTPIGDHLVADVDLDGLPDVARVHVVTDLNTAGTMVYGVPNHTCN